MSARLNRKRLGLITGLVVSGILLAGVSVLALSDTPDQPSDVVNNQAPGLGDGFGGGLPPQITLNEALKDVNINVKVPKYLPANARLEVVRRSQEGEYCVTQNYDLGDRWIDVIAIKKPQPDYAKNANPVTTAERVLPDGTRVPVTINSGALVMTSTADGTWEPVGIDNNSLVFIKGMPAHYVEAKGVGTVRMGKNPTRVSPRDFAAVSIWKDGVEYTVGGCNISRAEIIKIAESMF